ncbi:MAG: hypothetical protein IPH12_15175 [Saprospirales bacterium]|nr:hypothetical protein [Saprospirales bacterium]
MKPAHLIKGLSVALLFVFSSGIVLAQHPTETCPESALPVITFRPVQVPNAPPGTLYTNYFQFSVDWAGDAATCHNNPPLPIHPDQVDTAKWMYFWNFDDETYSGDTMPMHAFKESGTYTVEVALKPIYSDDKDPFKKPKATFSIVVPRGRIRLKKIRHIKCCRIPTPSNWLQTGTPPGQRANSPFAITYRVRSQSAISGKVLFLHSA